MIRRIKKHFIEATDIMLARPKMVFLMEKALNMKALNGYNVGVRVGKMVFAQILITKICQMLKIVGQDNGLMVQKTEHSIIHIF